ncbi:MAG: sigma-70 family RNA polymerase sigma factor [Verrucomicrobiae bacterium]|nr:sigma-70 family RNA polymerase sigma factor [Verrucomicrobiae bacterium]
MAAKDRGEPKKFPDTRWTLVTRVNGGDVPASQRALEELCRLYWEPILSFILLQGYSEHDAEDLTQGFFSEFLAREDFSKPDPDRGRLRSYLLGAVKHYLVDDARKNQRKKRGGDYVHVSIDESPPGSANALDPADPSIDQDRFFRQQWATTMLESVLQQLEAHYIQEEQEALFDALRPFVSLTSDPERQAVIADRLGMKPEAFRQAVRRMRNRYITMLKDAVATTLQPDEDVDSELRDLLTAFS